MAVFDPAPVLLVGTHVRLEPLMLAHAPGILAAGRFPEIFTHMPMQAPTTAEGAEDFIRMALAEQSAGRQIPFATLDARSGEVIGSTRYLDIQRPHRGIEIGGTWITPSRQRTAVNTEAKRLMLAHAFETLGAIRVQLKTDARNERSQQAIARIGGVREGTLRSHMIVKDERRRDTVFFSILDAEWPAVRARLDGMLLRE